MRVLLDTHVLLWWFKGDARMSPRADSVIRDQDNVAVISAAVGWELAIKARLGKMEVGPLVPEMGQYLEQEGFVELPVSVKHAMRAGMLPLHHRDPFDRLLVAQAQTENLAIVTRDDEFRRYDVTIVW